MSVLDSSVVVSSSPVSLLTSEPTSSPHSSLTEQQAKTFSSNSPNASNTKKSVCTQNALPKFSLKIAQNTAVKSATHSRSSSNFSSSSSSSSSSFSVSSPSSLSRVSRCGGATCVINPSSKKTSCGGSQLLHTLRYQNQNENESNISPHSNNNHSNRNNCTSRSLPSVSPAAHRAADSSSIKAPPGSPVKSTGEQETLQTGGRKVEAGGEGKKIKETGGGEGDTQEKGGGGGGGVGRKEEEAGGTKERGEGGARKDGEGGAVCRIVKGGAKNVHISSVPSKQGGLVGRGEGGGGKSVMQRRENMVSIQKGGNTGETNKKGTTLLNHRNDKTKNSNGGGGEKGAGGRGAVCPPLLSQQNVSTSASSHWTPKTSNSPVRQKKRNIRQTTSSNTARNNASNDICSNSDSNNNTHPHVRILPSASSEESKDHPVSSAWRPKKTTSEDANHPPDNACVLLNTQAEEQANPEKEKEKDKMMLEQENKENEEEKIRSNLSTHCCCASNVGRNVEGTCDIYEEKEEKKDKGKEEKEKIEEEQMKEKEEKRKKEEKEKDMCTPHLSCSIENDTCFSSHPLPPPPSSSFCDCGAFISSADDGSSECKKCLDEQQNICHEGHYHNNIMKNKLNFYENELQKTKEKLCEYEEAYTNILTKLSDVLYAFDVNHKDRVNACINRRQMKEITLLAKILCIELKYTFVEHSATHSNCSNNNTCFYKQEEKTMDFSQTEKQQQLEKEKNNYIYKCDEEENTVHLCNYCTSTHDNNECDCCSNNLPPLPSPSLSSFPPPPLPPPHSPFTSPFFHYSDMHGNNGCTSTTYPSNLSLNSARLNGAFNDKQINFYSSSFPPSPICSSLRSFSSSAQNGHYDVQAMKKETEKEKEKEERKNLLKGMNININKITNISLSPPPSPSFSSSLSSHSRRSSCLYEKQKQTEEEKEITEKEKEKEKKEEQEEDKENEMSRSMLQSNGLCNLDTQRSWVSSSSLTSSYVSRMDSYRGTLLSSPSPSPSCSSPSSSRNVSFSSKNVSFSSFSSSSKRPSFVPNLLMCKAGRGSWMSGLKEPNEYPKGY